MIVDVKKQLVEHFKNMSKDAKHLFTVDVDTDEMWNLYLESFDPQYNEIYRVRRAHDCSACRQFIKNVGNVVSIKNGHVVSIWDFECNDPEYATPVAAMSAYVHARAVNDVFLTKNHTCGVDKNRESIDGNIYVYDHWYVNIPDISIDNDIDRKKSEFRSARDVFERTMKEISVDAIESVLELISSNSLYKGIEWKDALNAILKLKKSYIALESDAERNVFSWEQSAAAGPALSRIKNNSIGVLLTDISEGMDLDSAVRRYEKIVAPENYKRPKPIYSQRQLDEAKKTVESLGYINSLVRRFARMDDISINNVLFADRNTISRIRNSTDVFNQLSADSGVDIKKFSKIDEVSIDTFINDVLPQARELEVLLENKHAVSMVSLIAPMDADAPSMFKWNNSFSWAYSGNMTDSSMKERVKSAGGAVDGVLRFSIQWNDGRESNFNDFDAHCIEPQNYRIYFANRHMTSPTGGRLDVDIVMPTAGIPAVENITWSQTTYMKDGKYSFYVHCFSNRGGSDGFEAEIECDGTIHTFSYRKSVRHGEFVHVADVNYSKTAGFAVVNALPSTTSSRELWGLKTQQFVPVSMVMRSPNCWNGEAIGNEHIFFMLKGCVNSETPNSFYNEFLKQELSKHRNVFEALGSKMKVESIEDQLSGIGFSSTKRAEIIVKVKGNTERVLKVKV